MNFRNAIQNLHAMGFPIYKEGLPGYYVVDVSQHLPRNRKELVDFIEALRMVDVSAKNAADVTYHVDGNGHPVYLCIEKERFEHESYELVRFALVYVDRTKTGLRRYRDYDGKLRIVGRNGLIKET